MTYWIITTEYPPFHGGGISTYNYHTAKMLASKGVHVTIFVSDYHLEKPLSEEVEDKNITVVRFKPADENYYKYLGYNTALSYHFAQLILDRIASSTPPHFIETQDYQGIGYYLLQFKRAGNEFLKNIPIVLTLHSPSYFYHDHCRAPLYKLPDFWIGEMEKWTMRAADIFISPSQFLIENNKDEIGDKLSHYNIVENPYAPASLQNDKHNITTGDIVFFGKLTYQKGILQLIINMIPLWDGGFKHPLRIIGADHFFELHQVSMMDYIKKKYRKYVEAGQIIFEGILHPTHINARLSKAHIIIVPSVVDNFPYTVVESMMLGKVLLVSDGGGQREIIEDGVSGFIYKSSEHGSFEKKINQIISLNKSEYEQIGKNAYKRIFQLCNYQTVYEKKIKILKDYRPSDSTTYPFTREIKRKITIAPSKEQINKKDRLSIVIPYYNTGKYIEETIKNIFEINYSDKEVIIVNDGSDEEKSLQALQMIEKKYKVKVIHQKNTGLPGARNTGSLAATGEFLAFLDADDKVDKDYHLRSISLLKQYTNVSFVGCWAQYFDGDNNCWPTFTPEPPYLLIHNPINSSSLIYKTNDFLASGLNDMDMMPAYEDYESVIHLVKNGFRGIVIPEPLFKYRIHPSSLSRTFNQQIHLDAYRLLTKKHHDFFKNYAIEIIHFLQANGPSHLYDNPTFAPHTDVQKLWEKISILEGITNDMNYNSLNKTYTTISNNYHELRETEFINILKENHYFKSQTRIISDWYHSEYEVLPLWYKRIGQVIKIITGKKKLFKN